MALARWLRLSALQEPRSFDCRQTAAVSVSPVSDANVFKAGTIFERTLLPLTKWFQGRYQLTQSKNSISGLELARQLGVRPDTASLMRHKVMSVMVDREASRKLDGRVEMDDAVLGG